MNFCFRNSIILFQISLLLILPGCQAIVEPIKNSVSTAYNYAKTAITNTHGAIQAKVKNALTDECVAGVNDELDIFKKYLYLRRLQKNAPEKFYNCISDNVEKIVPIVYTPVVGKATKNYKTVITEELSNGLIISISDKERIKTILEERKDKQEHIKLVLVTDGERTLGLGDMGVNAIAVLEGKLAVYSALGGIDPKYGLAVALDVGTNNEDFRSKLREEYVGRQEIRVTAETYKGFVDSFVENVITVFGRSTIIQFEGFSSDNSYSLLRKYKNNYPVYNDNIQGTSSIAMAGIFSATSYRKTDFKTAKYLFVGAGRAAVGLSNLLMMALGGITEENKKKIYMMDINGLITSNHCPFKEEDDERRNFCHEVDASAPTNKLEEIVEWVKPNILIGLSGAEGIFTDKVLENMKNVNSEKLDNCIIMPLGRPKSECSAELARQKAEECLFVSGAPFSPVFVGEEELKKEEKSPGSWFGNSRGGYVETFKQMQCNSDSIFPGIARGLVLAKMETIPNEVFYIAAQTLSQECVKATDLKNGNLYPELKDLKDCSVIVAAAIVKYAFDKGLTLISPKPAVSNYKTYVLNTQFKCGTTGGSAFVKAQIQNLLTTGGCVTEMEKKLNKLEQYIYLRKLQHNDEREFYKCIIDNVDKMLPIIYTPVVAKACKNYQKVVSDGGEIGLTLNIEEHEGRILQQLQKWKADIQPNVRAVVMTDGERILGLGDLGANGMGIPVGKLVLYTALGGVHPSYLLPVTLDVGTDNEEFLGRKANKYVGKPIRRVRGERYWRFIDEFVKAVVEVYGQTTLIQFEDFAKEISIPLVEKYRHEYTVFNDDIQGSAAVALAGLLAAERFRGTKLTDSVILFVGAGTAAAVISGFILEAMGDGKIRDESRKKIYMKDHYGLLTSTQCGHPTPYEEGNMRRLFCHDVPAENDITDLEKIILWLKPNVLIGVTGKRGIFTEGVLKNMATVNKDRPSPIIMPLSNPTSNSECTAEEAHRWVPGCLFASGSPFAPITVDADISDDEGEDEKMADTKKNSAKKAITPMQCNNDNIFPGLAFGIILSKMKPVPNDVFLKAAQTLANNCMEKSDFNNGSLYPPLKTLRSCSIKVAARVFRFALENGLSWLKNKPQGWEKWTDEEFETFTAQYQYKP